VAAPVVAQAVVQVPVLVLVLVRALVAVVRAVLAQAAVAQHLAPETPRIPTEAAKVLPARLARATKPHHARTVQPELDASSDRPAQGTEQSIWLPCPD
jgi:predicted aspartyl protease